MHPRFYMSVGISLLLLAAALYFVLKGVLVKKQQTCLKGQWSKIICNFATGMPRTFQTTFKSVSGGIPSGLYRESRWFWIFPQKPVDGKISPQMQFHRRWINAIYKVEVLPDSDVEVRIS